MPPQSSFIRSWPGAHMLDAPRPGDDGCTRSTKSNRKRGGQRTPTKGAADVPTDRLRQILQGSSAFTERERLERTH
jgi:hypothetical protein